MTTLALIDQIGGWWKELDLAKQLFYGIGIIAGLTGIIMAVLGMIGMDHQEGVDAVDADADGGGIFSIKPLTGFFLGFGWAGGIALSHGFSFPVALMLALGAGGGLMAVIVLMIRAILGLRSDGTMRIADTVGAVGTVYITLPANKTGGGQVVVNFRGRQETFAALNTSDRALASGEKVRVTACVDTSTVLVEPL